MFLYNELPTQHMHTLKLAIFDYAEAPGGYSFELQKEKLRARLDRLPPLRWRTVTTPLALNHPLWIEDAEFDLDYHVRRAALPAPGGPRELCELVGEVASRPLDRNHPLWELWMIEGVAGGQVAALTKIHHSIADGVASAEMLRRVLSPSPDEEELDPTAHWVSEAVPPKSERLRLAATDLAKFLAQAVPRMGRSLLRSHRLRGEHRRAGAEDPPKPYDAPPTLFNRPLSPQRRFAFTSLSLEAAKEIRSAFHCTINDVLLATVAGALRNYLFVRGELPGVPLIVSVPVSTSKEQRLFGNSTGAWYVNLPTHLEDPAERVRAVQHAVQVSREEFADTTGARLTDWMELFPPVILKQVFSRLPLWLLKAGRAPMANAIVSNVRGPSEELRYDGARMTAFYSVGPLLEGVAINITGWSYAGQMNLGLLACRDVVPNLWELAEQLDVAFEELLKASSGTA
jgi:WS/DGAT/MGAT family acyltransferase